MSKRFFRKLPKEEIEILYKGGKSKSEIARIYGVTPTTVRSFFKIHLIKTAELELEKGVGHGKRGHLLRVEDPSIIESLYHKEGKTLQEIGHIYGVTAVPVLYYMEKHKITRRTKSDIMIKRMSCSKVREKLRKYSTEAYLHRNKVGTKPERDFECWLKHNQIEYTSQYRKIGNGHPYDFFLPKFNLLVEIDGDYWHLMEKQQEKDRQHTKDAIDSGFQIVRINTSTLKDFTYGQLLNEYINVEKFDQ